VSRQARLRLLKFSFVGAMGVAVQLGALAVLLAAKADYRLATGLAVECAVIHNFIWHRRFTWAERASPRKRDTLAPCLRFHLSNGLISLVGNLLLMRLLVGWLGFPVLPANIAAIAACYAANFMASDHWVFLGSSKATRNPLPEKWISAGVSARHLPVPASAAMCAARMEDKSKRP
jgi:putative flippase GtrA